MQCYLIQRKGLMFHIFIIRIKKSPEDTNTFLETSKAINRKYITISVATGTEITLKTFENNSENFQAKSYIWTYSTSREVCVSLYLLLN